MRNGFTVLELLIMVTVLAVVGALAYGQLTGPPQVTTVSETPARGVHMVTFEDGSRCVLVDEWFGWEVTCDFSDPETP